MAIKDFGLRPYLRTSKDLPHGEDKPWKLVCTIPYNCHFQPWIEVESASGGQILFNSSNPLVLYLTPTETCDAKPGVQRYEAKNWVSGEGVVYTIPAGMTSRRSVMAEAPNTKRSSAPAASPSATASATAWAA